jgi:hypothetical protein
MIASPATDNLKPLQLLRASYAVEFGLFDHRGTGFRASLARFRAENIGLSALSCDPVNYQGSRAVKLESGATGWPYPAFAR